MKTVFFLILTVWSARSAITEHYVSSTGTDTYANSTNPATPMSLSTAFTNATTLDRINVKADGTYTVSSPGVSLTAAGPIFYRGYTATIGDGGKATIQGDATGAAYIVIGLSSTADNYQWQDFIFTKNGNSGAVNWFEAAAGSEENAFIRCEWTNCRRTGHYNNGITATVECEGTNCNTSNTAGNYGGMSTNLSGSVMLRNYCHGNSTGANCNGIIVDGGVLVYGVIASANGGNGYYSTGDTTATAISCDFYGNTGSGVFFNCASDMLLTLANCNFVGNTRYGFEFGTAFTCEGTFLNPGYGRGTQVNTLGDIHRMEGMHMVGAVAYANDVTPWNAPGSDDFKITLTAAKGTGRGSFLQTATSYTGTISYPDIGAAQHQE